MKPLLDTKKMSVDNTPNGGPIIPRREKNRIRDKRIRGLYREGLSMDEVVLEMRRFGYGVSKTTVFFAINGRYSKKVATRRKLKRTLKNNLKNI